MNVGRIYSKVCFWFVPACAGLCWVVVYGQLSAPQGHHANRDSRGLGPSPSGTPWPLKSCHFRAAVHGCVADLLGCSSGGEIWPGTRSDPASPPHPTPRLLGTHVHKCRWPFPFTNTSLMTRKEMLSTVTLFSHSCRG